MMRSRLALAVVAGVLALAGCTDERPPITRVGQNIVDKAVFTDSWYFSRTVIDVDYEGSALGTYPGDAAIDFADGALTSMPRIRWVIDEDTLYAYRDYEIVEGANGEVAEPGTVLGHPVAAFAIESHFDIRRQYNSVTGEEQNIVVENSIDKRWFDREFMRVDWSQNLLPGFYGQFHDLLSVAGIWTRESTALLIQPNAEFPASWTPQFHYMTCNGSDDPSEACLEEDRDWADDYAEGELYHMSFVTQEMMSPGLVNDPFRGQVNYCLSIFSGAPNCTSVAVFVRNSFLKVSDQREYERVNFVDTRFERHGFFRLSQPTFDRSNGPDDPAFGSTDFLNYAGNRYNIWRDWVDADGNAIPYADREVRPVTWYTTPELPGHLVKPAFQVVGEWNGVLVNTVRTLQGDPEASYPPVECQTQDPDAYCYCRTDEAGTVLNPTCAGRYDIFESPAEAEARGAQNPVDCQVVGPEGENMMQTAEPAMTDPSVAARLGDSDFWGWFDGRMVGSECHVVLRINSCNRASIDEAESTGEALRCQERGDARFKFFSYVDQPGTPFLGVATLRGDPVTGEVITGDANIGGPALDQYRTFALQTYDLTVGGDELNDPFFAGEDVRRYLEKLNRVQTPAQPRPNPHAAVLQSIEGNDAITRSIDNVMARALPRMELLTGNEGINNVYTYERNRKLVNEMPDEERRLFSNYEAFVLAGLGEIPGDMTPSQMNEHFLDQFSPFRVSAHELLDDQNREDDLVASRNIYMPNGYTDVSVTRYASERSDWPRARLEFGLNRFLMFGTQLHEMGHCFGLRHSFASSTDLANYHDDYYFIADAFPWPDTDDFDLNGSGDLDTADEQIAYDQAYDEVRRQRKLAGIDSWMNASTMEYMPEWYSDTPYRHGRYDNAAIHFGYGDVVEIIDNREARLPAFPENDDVDRLDTLENPLNAPRVWAKFYMGGESCVEDRDCPFSASGARSGELLAANQEAGLVQTCQPHPNPTVDDAGLCSNFDEDAQALVDANLVPDFAPVQYQFCTDNRAGGGSIGTLGACNRWDDGDSYKEIVNNIRDRHDRNYLWEAFRRYRRGFGVGTMTGRMFSRRLITLQSIYQNMLFRYAEDPEFRNSTGPFGFYDQFLASVDVLNFYTERLGNPGIGSYQWSNVIDTFRWNGTSLDSGQFNLTLADGARFFNSVYQQGLTGIQRIERVGSFYERLLAIQLLTQRGWMPSYTRDTPFLLNFYDVFPLEVSQVIGGIIREAPAQYSARLLCETGSGPDCTSPTVVYPDLYRGDCLSGDPEACRPPVQETDFGDLDIVEVGQGWLRNYATLLSMISFPTYFDTSYQNQLLVCVEGFGECQTPAPGLVEGEDFVRFKSERYLSTLIAFKTTTSTVGEAASIGFDLLTELNEVDFLWRVLQVYRGDFADGIPSIDNLTPEQLERITDIGYPFPPASDADLELEINRLQDRAEDLENYVNILVNYQRQLGILQIF